VDRSQRRRSAGALLYEVNRELTRLNLQISSAKISDLWRKVVDVFYVKNLFGHKVEQARLARCATPRSCTGQGDTRPPAQRSPPAYRGGIGRTKLYKANGPCYTAQAHLTLFLLFLRQIISCRHLLLGGNPGLPTVWRTQETAAAPAVSFAVPRLFWWNKSKKPPKEALRRDRVYRASDRSAYFATISSTSDCQFNKCSVWHNLDRHRG